MAITPIYNPAPDDPTADTLYQAGNKINNNEAFLDAKIDDEITNRTNAVALKADIASPAFTGNPTAPTPSAGDNDTSIANTEFVQNEIVSHAQIGKNLIFNGDNSVSQRGTWTAEPIANNTFYLDRWISSIGTVAATITHNKTNGSPSNSHTYTVNVTTGGVGYIQFVQRLENYKVLQGKTLSYAVEVKSNRDFEIFLPDCNSGSARTSYTGGGAWQTVKLEGVVADIGATEFRIFVTTNTGDTNHTVGQFFEIGNAQLELGSESTDFEVIDYNIQLNRCGVPDDSSTFGYKPFYETIVSREQAGKNLLINPDKAISQRGDFATLTPIVSSLTYVSDRYVIGISLGAGACSYQRVGYVSDAKGYVHRLECTTATGNGWMSARHAPFEDSVLQQLAGKTITYTAMVRSNIPVNIVIQDNSNLYSGMQHSGNGQWEKLTITRTVTSSLTFLYCWVTNWDTAGSGLSVGDYIEVGYEQVELGSEATEFEIVDPATQLARCQRYYQIFEYDYGGSTSQASIALGFGVSTTLADFQLPHIVSMRTPPHTLEIYNSPYIEDTASGFLPDNWSLFRSNRNASSLRAEVLAGGLIQHRPYSLLFTNFAVKIALDAEL